MPGVNRLNLETLLNRKQLLNRHQEYYFNATMMFSVTCHFEQVVKVAKNSLNNRFVPYDVIETDAIFAVDDDVEMRHEEILLAFR